MLGASPYQKKYWGQKLAIAGLNCNRGHQGFESKLTIKPPLKEVMSPEIEQKRYIHRQYSVREKPEFGHIKRLVKVEPQTQNKMPLYR
jgi:hypothetical protein